MLKSSYIYFQRGCIIHFFCASKKVKAGALQYVIFISVVIALLLGSFVLLNYLQQKLRTQINFFNEVVQTTTNSFEYLRSNEITYENKNSFRFAEDASIETTLQKKHWGLFDIIYSKNSLKTETFEKIAMFGGKNINKPALYLKDKKRPLVVVGNTKIKGETYLPELKVKRGYIGGNSYYNSELIYGPVYKSNTTLPKIKNRTYLKNITQISNKEDVQFWNLEFGTQKTNSFQNKTLAFQSPQVIHLKNISLTGNIIIQSDTLIKISQSALLKDVLLIAPRIEVLEKVTGSFQAFATKEILVAKNCQLIYPSVLLLYEKSTQTVNKESAVISIHENVKMQGVIAYLSDIKKNTYKAQIYLSKNVVLYGEVYCDKNIDTQGQINGSVYTNGFVANQFGSVYQNHLYNAGIDVTSLPKEYIGISFTDTQQGVARWMY